MCAHAVHSFIHSFSHPLLCQEEGPYRNQDETVELALNLNLDPRKPGQALRGALSLPHGNGKKVSCVVFTRDKDAIKAALEAGAAHAGGDELVEDISNGTIPLDFDCALATPDMQSTLAQKLARTLGPRGLMPNAKVGTLVPSAGKLVDALKDQLAGQVQYRTDKTGIIHLGVGKGSFAPEQLLDNVRSVMNEIYEIKPESFGKKKASKNAKYFLRAHLTSAQGASVRVDLRTVDPTSTFFMGNVVE
jgi:large subunit ribosomal protein L1